MNEVQVLKRKIQLKRQATTAIKNEILEIQERLLLIFLKGRFEKRIGKSYDPTLGRKLDCVTFLLEN